MNIKIVDGKIENLTELSDFIRYTATPLDIDNLTAELSYYRDRNAMDLLEVGTLAHLLKEKKDKLINENNLESGMSGKSITLLPNGQKGHTSVSNKVGAITIGLLISGIAATAVMYALLAIVRVIK